MAKPALPWHWAVPCAVIAGGACWLGYKAICNKTSKPTSLAANLPCAAANVMAAFNRTLRGELSSSHASQGALCAMTDQLSILRLLAKGKLGLKPQRTLDDQV